MSLLTSPLDQEHRALGATMVEFAGWDMPVRYTSDIAEHTAVRTAAGLFDLSHMAELMVRGRDAAAALDYALIGHISRMPLARAKYTMLCDDDGGIVDDVVVYRRDWDHFMIVANAANRAEVVSELRDRFASAGLDATVDDETDAIALIAIQGPASAAITASMCELGDDDIEFMKYYSTATVLLHGGIHAFVARTGYTGEDGFELYVPVDNASDVWRLAHEHGAAHGMVACGLAARDSLRLEAGMPLYGNELTRHVTPFEAGLGRVVNFGTEEAPRGNFVGHDALARIRDEGVARRLVGLVGEGGRSARTGYSVSDDEGNQIGVVTSGAPSPTLGMPIAMAYVPTALAHPGTELGVDVRGRHVTMRVVALPFYSRGD